jgi:hypothetical protein
MAKNKQVGNYSNFLLFLLCFFLLFLLFRWLNFLLDKSYLQPGTYLETFSSSSNVYNANAYSDVDSDTDAYSGNNTKSDINNNTAPYDMYKLDKLHSNTIDMSAFSKYTCSNWCGPKSECLLSREQCSSDVDCKGCEDLTALNNYYDDSTTDTGQSYMNKSTKDIPKGANEDILCSINNCNNSFARFDKRD